MPFKFRRICEVEARWEYYFLINLCIALKFAGKEFTSRLNSVDWTSFHPKYHFAVAVLEDRFTEAEKLMRTPAVYETVGEFNFKTWPLLREFRKTDQFQRTFKAVFKKDFAEQIMEDAAQQIKAEQPGNTNAPTTKMEKPAL